MSKDTSDLPVSKTRDKGQGKMGKNGNRKKRINSRSITRSLIYIDKMT